MRPQKCKCAFTHKLPAVPPLTLYQVLCLLGHIPPGLAFKREVSLFDFLHYLLSAGVGQALLLTLKRHLPGQHGVLQTEENPTICCQVTMNTVLLLKHLKWTRCQCSAAYATCLFCKSWRL